MKLLVDLFPCQSESRLRGIGRYTYSLIREMAKTSHPHKLVIVANASYQDQFEGLRREFTNLLPPGSFLPYRYPDLDPNLGENDPCFEVAATLLRHAYQSVNPDFILYPSIFEGWGEKGIVALPNNGLPNSSKIAIIHDFIPYLFPERFLEPDPYFKKYYLKRLDALKEFDLLLSNSESTRQDAIKILGVSPDHVINISSAASDIFKRIDYSNQEIDAFLWRFRISKPFVFYTGNVEYHKNIEPTLRAFSKLPDEVRRNHQFVLTHVGDETAFRNKIRALGLEDHEVVITGHISDQDLVTLYNCCKLFIFPSLYEGFGLPILEAMACGAPVIASDNSSIPEVMGRKDAMFTASSEQAIIEALYKGLTDEDFRKDLTAYGLERVKQFGWDKSAHRAWSALEKTYEEGKEENHIHISTPVNGSKLHVAYVSPLPPQKSGIADYSAELLPSLSQYFDLDLFTEPESEVEDIYGNKKFRIYPWKELIDRQDLYDTVIYQFGNSKYHKYMFHLLRQVPGVVVLHDFYLSHIREYIYSTNYSEGIQENSNFLLESGEMHGLFSMVDFVQRGIKEAIWDWPLNWDVLKYAKEIIVHSSYQNSLIRKYYGQGWFPQTTIVNQLRKIEDMATPEEKRLAKQKLDINPDSFTFCSFGFLNSTKLNLLTINAFAKYLFADDKATLIFIGEIEKGPYEQSVIKLIDELGISEHIIITGFVDNELYRCYLDAADAALQLRTHSRGETSRAVLDCMAFGIPTIINAHGTLNDYDEQDIIKLSEYPEVDEITQAMSQLALEQGYRQKIGENAQNAIRNNHNPDRIASAYYDVILQASRTSDRNLFAPMVDALIKTQADTRLMLPSLATIAATNLSLRNQPRLLLDVTNIAQVDLRTGIQRVVKSLIKAFYAKRNPSHHIELVRINEGKLYRAFRFTEKLFTLPEGSLGIEAELSIQPGDTLFMLDTSWNLFDQFAPIFTQLREAGGRIFTMLYDLIPIRHPEFCTGPTVALFANWIDKAICNSDEIICISRAVANDMEDYISENPSKLSHVCRLSYIHLGADVPVIKEESKIREEVQQLVDDHSSPLFIMVGTIEPRKGHAFTINAFEQLWHQGENHRLCIIGKIGWNVEALVQRIKTHPELEKHLFFIENATDAEVNLCYKAGTALIAASVAEGFGLPIVEAALHQVPVLASDIPVFHEVGGDGAIYFSLESPCNLAEVVREMAKKSHAERVELAKKVKCLSWEESATKLLDILERKQ